MLFSEYFNHYLQGISINQLFFNDLYCALLLALNLFYPKIFADWNSMAQHILLKRWRLLYNLHNQIEMFFQRCLLIENIAKIICIEYFIHKEIVVHNKGISLCEFIERLDGIFEVKLMISAHDSCMKGSVNVNQYMHADIVYVAE